MYFWNTVYGIVFAIGALAAIAAIAMSPKVINPVSIIYAVAMFVSFFMSSFNFFYLETTDYYLKAFKEYKAWMTI